MPFESEHVARQKDPSLFVGELFRSSEGLPAGISALMGRRTGEEKPEVQSFPFAREQWTTEAAREWLGEHGHSISEFEPAGERNQDGVIRFDAGTVEVQPGERVRRFDLYELEAPRRTRHGFLRAQGFISRAGVFDYEVRDAAGQTRRIRELRPPQEVFDAESVESFALAPMTLGHPPDNLGPDTVARYQVGQIGRPDRADDHLRSDLLITAKSAIDAVDQGVHELSCGYSCQTLVRPGTYTDAKGSDHRFDAVQVGILGNHVAIVPEGRAGPTASIRLDSGDGTIHRGTPQTRNDMAKIKIDGTEYDVPDAVAAFMKKKKGEEEGEKEKEEKEGEDKKDSTELRGLRKELAKAQGQLDVLTAESKKRKDDIDAKAAKEQTAKSRADALKTITTVAPLLGKEPLELVELEPGDLRRQVVVKLAPDVKLDGKSDEYVEAAFDAVIASRSTSEQIAGAFTGVPQIPRSDGKSLAEIAAEAHRKSVDALTSAWKPGTDS